MKSLIFNVSYLLVGIAFTAAVAIVLHRGCRIFLAGAYDHATSMVSWVSGMIVTCFCLLMGGFITNTASFQFGQQNFAVEPYGLMKFGELFQTLGWTLIAALFLLGWLRSRGRRLNGQSQS
jgi:hypothetical protein